MIDDVIVMPNHLHGILVILDQSQAAVPDMMRWFKSMTTTTYIRGVKQSGWESFEGKLWQQSYYDHIVRSEADLNNIRQYIQSNPARWERDEHYYNKHGQQ